MPGLYYNYFVNVKSNNFADAGCRSACSRHIERNSDNIIVIYDRPAGTFSKPLLWMMACSILGIAILGLVTSQGFSAIPVIVLFLLCSIAFLSRQTKTEMNPADRTVRMTRKVGLYEWKTVYSLDDIVAVEVTDESRMIEGYPLPLYSVKLIGKKKEIAIYSTDDPREANVLREEIATFLKRHDLPAGSSDRLF